MEREEYFKRVLKDFDATLDAIRNAKNLDEISENERKIRPLFIELQLALPMVENDILKVCQRRREELKNS